VPQFKKNGFKKNFKKNCPEVVIGPEVRKSIMASGVDVQSSVDVESAERRCVAIVTNRGVKLKFALMQVGLNYKSNTPEYHRIRRKVCQQKEKKKQRTGIMFFICDIACFVIQMTAKNVLTVFFIY